ncbi:SNF2 family N-terminal domain-containing protein [Lentinula detonsa]|uniref:SNF2 family N-terminal domain-containing protein n=1 Tax=Lentinula detonsa TaxID=2804962 RepID=A0AA38UMK7_9AGAR|nr:SNF2 family N-terminal domain-containing protein [Lentinula detonsa]
MIQIVTHLLGDGAVDEQRAVYSVVKDWWHSMISALLDTSRKYKIRALHRLLIAEKRVKELLGEDFLQSNMRTDFTVKVARVVITALKRYAGCLTWQVVTTEDEKIQSKVIDLTKPDALAKIRARYEKLSDMAKRKEFCQVALGWMQGILAKKLNKEVQQPDLEGGDLIVFNYGVKMADAVPRSQVDAMATPEPIEVAQFERQLQDFSDMWLGRDRPDDGLSTALSLFEGDNIEEMRKVFFTDSEDIGVERFAKMTEEDLHVYLGIPSGIPAVFRKYTADDPESIPLGNSGTETFEGAEEVGLSWHQEVWLAAMVGLSVNSAQAEVEGIHHTEEGLEKAPMAIREKWGTNPGIALLDEVGLGKTMEAIAGIGLLQTLHKVKRDWKPESGLDKLPACIRTAETFGGRAAGIPDAPHLIVVPTNLIDQWASELRRFMNPKAVDLIVVSTNAKKWQSDMRRLVASPQPMYRRVVLITHKIVQRMFSIEKLEIVANEVQYEPRLRYQLPRHTVFGYSWGSIWVDELISHSHRSGAWFPHYHPFENSTFSRILNIECHCIRAVRGQMPLVH